MNPSAKKTENADTPEARFVRGETLEGPLSLFGKGKWELNRKELKITGLDPIPLKQITHVERFNKKVKIWTDGVEPVYEYENSPNMRGLARVLSKVVKTRIKKGEDLSCKAPSGRLHTIANIWPRGSIYAGAFFLLGLAILFTVVMVTHADSGGLIYVILLYILGIAMFFVARMKGPQLECFDHEVHKIDYLGKRTALRYDDIQAMKLDVLRVISTQKGNKDKVKTKLMFESPTATIHFRDGNGLVASELNETAEFVGKTLIGKFWNRLEQGESIPFGSVKLTKDGLIDASGEMIPYSEIAEIRLDNGVASFFKHQEKKAFLKIKSKELNFLPCYNLLVHLAESKMTYTEFCDSQVKPVFGDA